MANVTAVAISTVPLSLWKWPFDYGCAVLSALGVFGNVLVAWCTFGRSATLKTSSNKLIGTLALFDIVNNIGAVKVSPREPIRKIFP